MAITEWRAWRASAGGAAVARRTVCSPTTTSKLIRRSPISLKSIGEPAGTRTQDPMIKSHVLYRLSYGLGAHSILKSLEHFQP
jgi:hypothetical protein